MRGVFLDTVGLLALWDQTDQWHLAATRALADVVASGARTVATTFILLECGNAAARRPYRLLADEMRDALSSGGKLIVPTEVDWDEAWAAYRRGDAGGAGVVDQVSFVVMRRLQIHDAFTNDRHFRAAGFNTLF
jgi:predicted nucleic acid-binding protein